MREQIRECERAAYAGGLATGLAIALTDVDTDAPPGPVAAVPSTWVTAEERVILNAIAREEGISFLRRTCRFATPPPPALGARLGAVRLGVTRRLAERVVRSLSERIAGGEPIIRKQLVAGTLADAGVETEVLRACLLTAPDSAAAVADAHDRLTAMDWELAKLLGASGYAGPGHAGAAHASRLVANCWVPWEAA